LNRPSPIMDRVLAILTAAPGLTVAQIAERAAHRRATTPRRVALRTKTTAPQD